MSRLIGLYLRYLHPIQRLVDETGPDFWTRLQKPLLPGIASVVYAMCTMGAVFETKAPTAGLPDGLTLAYFRRTCAALDQGPEDMTTVQALLIMVPFYAVSNQEEEGQKAYDRSHNVAEKIQLGDAAMRLSTQEKLSAKDVEIRNTWRSLVWLETIANLTLLRSGPIELFQSISKIKLPMSPRDVHAVTSILDAFGAWHSLLPKSLRAHSSKSASSSKSPFSPHAAILDLYYRLGQILLLNNLPQSTRSSPTGLGPRREPPLRTLATCANGITATISDFLKSADLKNYCLSHGMRCLTEAATIQMANTRESDPNISTPAKVNLMKTLWCIRQINFGLPAGKLSAILESFDASKATAPEPDVESRDYRGSHLRRSVSSRPRTSSISAMSLDSPQLSTASLAKRTTSPSDQGFSVSDGSMADGLTLARSQLSSPTHDISASSLLSLSLDSPSTARLALAGLPGLQVEPLDRYAPYRVREYLLSRRDQILEAGQDPDEETRHSGRDSRLADRSRSSSFSVFSPRTESSTSSMVSMSEVQSSRPTFQPVTTQAWETYPFVQPSTGHDFPSPMSYSDPRHPSEENMIQKYNVVQLGTGDQKYPAQERKGSTNYLPLPPPPLPSGRTTQFEYDDAEQSLLASRYGQPLQWRPSFSLTDPSLRRPSSISHPSTMSSLQDRDQMGRLVTSEVSVAYPVRQDQEHSPTAPRPGSSEYPSRSPGYFDLSHNTKRAEHTHASPPHTWSAHPLETKRLATSRSHRASRDDSAHVFDPIFTPPVGPSTFQGPSSTGRFRAPSRQGSQRTRASSLTIAQRTGPSGPGRAMDSSRSGDFPEQPSAHTLSRRGSTRRHPFDGPEDTVLISPPVARPPYMSDMAYRASLSHSLPIDIESADSLAPEELTSVGERKSAPIPEYPISNESPSSGAAGAGSRGRKRPSLSMYGGDDQETGAFSTGMNADRGREGSNVELLNHGQRHSPQHQHDPQYISPAISPHEEQPYRYIQSRMYEPYHHQRREQRELQLHLLRLQQEQAASGVTTSPSIQSPAHGYSSYSYDQPHQQQPPYHTPLQQPRAEQGPVRPDRGEESMADVPRDPIRRKYR
ncbi:hypothetical protein BGZ92_000470 [Podila epicladia]|nr:hypothetical protein BGZ92_000470 [Podila epicladia]